MAQKKDNKNKPSMGTSRAYDRKGNAADVRKAIDANTKKYNAMTPAQKKAYNAKQVKSVVKGVVTVASMVGGAGLARKAGVAAARKVVASGVTKKTAVEARARGKQYQSEVNRFVNWEKTSSKMPGWDKDMARKSDKAFEAMKLRSKIKKARNK